jgi:hypothetical protein
MEAKIDAILNHFASVPRVQNLVQESKEEDIDL